MSTEPAQPEEPATPTPTPSPTIVVGVIPREARYDFDAAVREIANVSTPIPEISGAVMARSEDGSAVYGVAYFQGHQLMSPLFILDGAPTDVLAAMADKVTEQLAEAIGELEEGREVSYDIYV